MKKNAIISCNSGSGFIKIMKELECDYVIEGGQSNNPSAQDIIEAIDNVNAENVDKIVKDEIGLVFAKVLEHAGVFKRDEAGKEAFRRFINTL